MRLINIDKLQEGMYAGQDLYDEHNRLMLGRGAAIRGTYVTRLKQLGLPALYIQEADTSDITVPQAIPPVARAKAIQNLTSTFSAVSQSIEGFRQLSVDEARQHIRSKRFMDTFKSATGNQGINQMLGDVDTLVDQLMNKTVIMSLNSIKTHDNYTFQHSIDVAIMGLLLAQKIGWTKERLNAFGIGCLLHDLGKIFIENEILNKPGQLTEAEYDIMKAHPTLGYELVKAIAPTINTLIPHVAYQHHERQDGSGYPRGIKGNNRLGKNQPNTIHDFGAVAAVADIYDAMASDRNYRRGWPPGRVVRYIKELSGSHLNPTVVEIFEKTVAPYPIGTGIHMRNGSLAGYEGVVSDINDQALDRPTVRLIFNKGGERIDPIEVNLQEEGDLQIESVRDGRPEMEPLGSSKKMITIDKEIEQSLSASEPTPDATSPELAASDVPLIPLVTEEGKICPSCGYMNGHQANFCSECGTSIVI